MLQKPEKILFDIHNKDHVTVYHNYLKNQKWDGSCPFLLEEPFKSVPHMIERKISFAFCELVEEGCIE